MLFLLALANPVNAADVFWSGQYRARGWMYNSLSLSESNPNAEGKSAGMDHHLRLQPSWRINQGLSIHTQFDLLPAVLWGDTPVTTTGAPGEEVNAFFSDSFVPPTDGEGNLQHFQVSRLWSEVKGDWGHVRFGRMPHHWGMGMVHNAGNGPLDTIGDSVDRIQYTARVEEVFLLAALDTVRENTLNVQDDTWGAAAGMMYNTEKANSGLYAVYRRQNIDDATFGMLTLDLSGTVKTGPLNANTEIVFEYGQGDLEGGLDDISRSAFGALADIEMNLEGWVAGLAMGFAQGDKDTTDKEFHQFTFDENWDLGLLIFNHSLPTLKASVITETNLGREFGAARTGPALSNAMFLRPKVGYQIQDNLDAAVSFAAARAAALPEDQSENAGYGMEIDGDVHYRPIPHFELRGTVGVFLPGPWYTNYAHEELGGGFDQMALGGRILATSRF